MCLVASPPDTVVDARPSRTPVPIAQFDGADVTVGILTAVVNRDHSGWPASHRGGKCGALPYPVLYYFII